jgi:hypothetical protein
MKIQLRFQGQTETVRQLFEKAGWHVDSAVDNGLCLSHSKLTDEADARRQLDAMGLLTSRGVHIEFWPSSFAAVSGKRGRK